MGYSYQNFGRIFVLYLAVTGVTSRIIHAESRLSIAQDDSYSFRDIDGPGTYVFGYNIDDPETGNTQYRDEQRYPNGTVAGSYGYVDPYGNPIQVSYVADSRGYRATLNRPSRKAARNLNASQYDRRKHRMKSTLKTQRRK